MEDRKVNTIAVLSVIVLIILIIVVRVSLKLSKAFYLVCGVDVTIILAVFACIFVRHHYNRRRKLLESTLKSEGHELRIEYSFLRKVAGVPTKFRYKELEEATDGFQAFLGRGSSASVFKGILTDGTSVAVKRIIGEERGEREFRSEVAAIASVQHVNLVRLIGYCNSPTPPRYLVYEYIPNGSLDCWIFPRKEGGPSQRPRKSGCLPWNLRYRVAIDVAKALSYLQHDCRSRVLHLDVKPENILLDENYKALVSDFGLSKLMGKDESQVVTTVRGTRGYLAPEWILEKCISEKTDIYSYGIVLLEMVGGRRNVSLVEDAKDKTKKKWQYFPKIVNQKVREGKFMEIVDQRLLECHSDIDERQVRRLVYVALWCIQEKPRLRPAMATVVEMLEGRVSVDEPPDTRMILVDLFSVDEDDTQDGNNLARLGSSASQVQSNGDCSTYSLATTVLSGR